MDERRAMQRAMDLAAPAYPHPNPRVGAVVLAAGTEIGSGFHAGVGQDHAEVGALLAAGDAARGATMVVTLEPCAHTGRTLPCVDAIISAGIARVVVGAMDPDPRVSGSGLAGLREAGIEVELLEDAGAEAVDPGYFHHRRTGRPLVTLKSALTLDGQTAAADGSARWISSEEAREDGHRLRASSDAVMVGAGTLRSDDPQLDVRLPGYEGRQPRPVVIAGSKPLPAEAKLWDRDPIIVSPVPIDAPGELIVTGKADEVDLGLALDALGSMGIVDVMVEGGAGLATGLLRGDLVDRAVLYVAAALAGGVGRGVFTGVFPTIAALRRVSITDVTRLGPDLRLDIDLKEY